MPKCYLHGQTETETENKPKPLKEHPGWPDRTKDYQQNLAIILTPTPKKQHIKPYRWYDFEKLIKERDLLARGKEELKNLETKAQSLLNKELFPEQIEQELNKLKSLFTNANLPNTYGLLAENCQQLLTISQIFETGDYDYEGIPSRPSSRPPSPTGEDEKKTEELKEEIKFWSNQAQNYFNQINQLTVEIDDKDVEIEELKDDIQQLKKKNKQETSGLPKGRTQDNLWNRRKKEWFAPQRWLTDKEIDWALEQIISELAEENRNNYKVLEASQFMYVLNAPNSFEADGYMAFPTLLSELTGFTGELVFIPVNNPNFHWSLLVYETFTGVFYHFDTSNAANYKYAKPLVKKLLEQIHRNNEINLKQYLVEKHDIKQGNGHDCGVAVIAFTERIIQGGINANLTDLDKNFGPERIKWCNKLTK